MNEEKLIEEVKRITHPFCFDDLIAFAKETCPHPNNSFCQMCGEEVTQIHELYKKYTYLKGNEELLEIHDYLHWHRGEWCFSPKKFAEFMVLFKKLESTEEWKK